MQPWLQQSLRSCRQSKPWRCPTPNLSRDLSLDPPSSLTPKKPPTLTSTPFSLLLYQVRSTLSSLRSPESFSRGSWRWLASGFLMVCLFGKEEKEGKIGTFLFRVLFGCLSNIFPKNKHDNRQLWLVLFSSHPLCFVRKFLPGKLKMGDECFLVAKGTERKIGMFYFGLVCYWWKWNFWGTEQQKDSRKGFSSKLDWKGTIGFPTKIPLLLMDNISWKISQESWICMINGGLSALFGCKDKKRREKWNILFSVNFVLMGVKL